IAHAPGLAAPRGPVLSRSHHASASARRGECGGGSRGPRASVADRDEAPGCGAPRANRSMDSSMSLKLTVSTVPAPQGLSRVLTVAAQGSRVLDLFEQEGRGGVK